MQDESKPQLLGALVDRRGNAEDITQRVSQCPIELFAGTLLDCERMPDQTIYGFDVVAYRGTSYRKQPYSKALAAIKDCSEKMASSTVRVVAKPAFPSGRNARRLLEAPGVNSDGVVLTAEAREVEPGPCTGIWKFKPKHTIDLGVSARDGRLFVGDRNSNCPGLPQGWKPTEFRTLRVAYRPVIAETGFVVREFEIGETDPSGLRQLVPMRDRPDKRWPNTMMTIQSAFAATAEALEGKDVADVLRC